MKILFNDLAEKRAFLDQILYFIDLIDGFNNKSEHVKKLTKIYIEYRKSAELEIDVNWGALGNYPLSQDFPLSPDF